MSKTKKKISRKGEVKPIRAVEESMSPKIRFKCGLKIQCSCCSVIIGEFASDVAHGVFPKREHVTIEAKPKGNVRQTAWCCPRCGEPFINEIGDFSTELGWL